MQLSLFDAIPKKTEPYKWFGLKPKIGQTCLNTNTKKLCKVAKVGDWTVTFVDGHICTDVTFNYDFIEFNPKILKK
jgi:hypothetical protein